MTSATDSTAAQLKTDLVKPEAIKSGSVTVSYSKGLKKKKKGTPLQTSKICSQVIKKDKGTQITLTEQF